MIAPARETAPGGEPPARPRPSLLDIGSPADPGAARDLQRRLAGSVVRDDRHGPLRSVAGIDMHVDEQRKIVFAAVALLRLDDLLLEESVLATAPLSFPYRSGLLSFREAPAALRALERLGRTPDLLMVDGQGIAHPRRLGIAAHLGVLLDLPSIGVAKSRLCGRADEPGPAPGASSPLLDKGECLGAVLRTRAGTRPLYVSTGHRVSLATALELTLGCCRGRRLPEPTRQADALSRCHG